MKKFIAGMNKDPERVDQLDNTFRDALNANIYTIKGAVVSEQSNQAIAPLFSNGENIIQEVIGQCALEDGRIILFVNLDRGDSAITIVDPKTNNHTILYVNAALNFKKSNTIEATAKVNSQNNILIYFTDNYIVREIEPVTGISYVKEYNPPRVFNVTKQENSLQLNNSSNEELYGSSEFTVDKLDLFLNAGEIPQFEDVRIDEGGGVVSGTYHLAIAYKDEDGNETNYLATSNQVYIVSAHEDSFPTDVIAGDPQGSQTNKSIVWNITIPAESNYEKIQPVVIQRFGGGINQQSSEFAYKLQEQLIPAFTGEDRTMEITYTGLESISGASVSEVVIDTVRYETAKTLVQLDNRLFLSNMQSRGDIGYQRFANNIQLSPTVKTIRKFDPKYYDVISLNSGYSFFDKEYDNISTTTYISEVYKLTPKFEDYEIQKNNQQDQDDYSGTTRKGYKDVKLSHKFKSFRRSEVYAFYISFVLNDGTETYAYHIPGRAPENIAWDDFGTTVAETARLDSMTDAFQYNVIDTEEITNLFPDAKLYQAMDTSLIDVNNNRCGYWENENETYPNTPDFSICNVDTDGAPIELSNTLVGKNVRHHKMPSNKQSQFSYIEADGTASNTSPAISEYTNMSNYSIQAVTLTEDINILGIKLSNIKIPEFILNQVQGYKIYYAKREQNNKTIIGQSISTPGAFLPNTAQAVGSGAENASPYFSPERAIFMQGILPPLEESYNRIESPYGSVLAEENYLGSPVIGFHDFNLLKNKHSLSVATHIDVQKAIAFRQWAGGNGNEPKDDNGTEYFVDAPWKVSSVSPEIKAYATSILIGAAYFDPNPNDQFGHKGENIVNSKRSIFVIKPKSITYLPADTSLSTTGGTEFHGIDRIINFKGESKIIIGLESGLPRLIGWHHDGAVARNVTTDSMLTTYQNVSSWYRIGGYYNITTGSKRLFANVGNQDTYPNADDYPIGLPAAYLINLCSLKTDVYKSFDDQKLVWTGYYQKIDDKARDNYFVGAESDQIFGGDTYISRFSFRMTGVPYGFSTLKQQSQTLETTPNDIPFYVDTSGNEGYIGDAETGAPPESNIPENWAQTNNSVYSTLFSFVCETDDLLGFRHSADQTAGVLEEEGMLFDKSVAADVIFNGPDNDNTHMDNLLYMNNYSLNQDIRVAIPFPKTLNATTEFPTRTIRSQNDEGSIADRYREFLALEFKDIPKNRGDVWKLFTLGSVLYMHTERSLFITKGKENLQLGDGSQAFIGSGDIFQQDPDELIPTTEGYGGTDSQFTGITTRYGQFFFNRRDKKAYILSDGITEASAAGMEKWFLDNTPYELEAYGLDVTVGYNADSPTDVFGFVAVYDPKFKRILLTKNEVIPTTLFKTQFDSGNIVVINNKFYVGSQAIFGDPGYSPGDLLDLEDTSMFTKSGWTVSYYPELKVWGSRHSYIPRLYSNTAEEYYSLINIGDQEDTSSSIWEHSDYNKSTTFFNKEYSFEFEFIDNTNKGYPKVFSSIYYSTDVVNIKDKGTLVHKHTNPGFTSMYTYNTRQISGDVQLSYIKNCRLVHDLWYVNDFRDLAAIDQATNLPSEVESMFISEGNINNNYIDTNKPWFTQSRFTDTYLGVRLMSEDNDNFIYLYSAGTKHRNSYR